MDAAAPLVVVAEHLFAEAVSARPSRRGPQGSAGEVAQRVGRSLVAGTSAHRRIAALFVAAVPLLAVGVSVPAVRVVVLWQS